MLDNTNREMDDETSTLFWKDSRLDGSSLFVSFRRLFELTDNELIIVADMYLLRWGVNGEA